MQDFKFPLVTTVDGEARASSEVIARGVMVQHKNVLALIRKQQANFEAFGPIAFETRLAGTKQGGGRHVEYAMLNEHQASLLIAFMRNTPKVIDFKVALIKEFFRMRDALSRREQSLWQQMHALIAQEVESKVRASFGSHLMLERKKEIPWFASERDRLESEMQPPLFPELLN